MAPETLSASLRNSARPVFLFGLVPPKEGTSIENARESCIKFSSRGAVLATDGFVVYDLQSEVARTSEERPFPFRKCMDAAEYASFFPAVSGKRCVVYKSIIEERKQDFDKWLDNACVKYEHNTLNLVGYTGLDLNEAGKMIKRRKNVSFGCVCIPERHTLKGDENLDMVQKSEFGADWFTTQGIFSAGPVSKLLNDYGDICREKGLVPAAKRAVARAEVEVQALVFASGTIESRRQVEFGPLGRIKMRMDPPARRFCQPLVKLIEKLGKAFEHRIGGAGLGILQILAGKSALHVKPGPAASAPLHGLGKQPVDLAGIGFGQCLLCPVGRQENLVQLVGLWPDLAGNKTIGAAQQLQMVIVENVRFALKIEF